MEIPEKLGDEAFLIYRDEDIGITGGHRTWKVELNCINAEIIEKGTQVVEASVEGRPLKYVVNAEMRDPRRGRKRDGGLVIRAIGLTKAKADGLGDDFDVWDQKLNGEWEMEAQSVLEYTYTPIIGSMKKLTAWLPIPTKLSLRP